MNKNKFLLLFIVCCALPLLGAKIVLELGWFNPGSSSKGQWLQQEYFLLEDASQRPDHWRIALIPQQDCQQSCLQALHTIKQMYIGLGRKQVQVVPVLIGQIPQPAEYPMFQQAAALIELPEQLRNTIVLVDRKGLVLLSYPMPEQAEDMAETARSVRADLLKLMNYDRTSV
ncbi:hypothetical protein [Arsukibacterium sp.]|jgi:hypothetical protein|uniref:hypothetical protein n=1 Tax=Arsukibacterium sp. TaxID=1977258 RepID=UPI002FDB8881